MNKPDGFEYWKKPWQKWLLVLAAAFQLWSAWTRLRGYKTASLDIYSADALADVAAETYRICAVNIWAAATFLGVFFIGIFVRSRKQADIAEGVFCLLTALLWSAICLKLDMFRVGGTGLLCAAMAFALLVGGVFLVRKSRKK